MELWTKSFEVLQTAPILGIGYGGFEKLTLPGRYPHNIFFELLLDHGLIIGSIQIFIFVYPFYYFLKKAAFQIDKFSRLSIYNEIFLQILPIYYCQFIPLIFSGDWLGNRMHIPLLFMNLICIFKSKSKNLQKNTFSSII